MSAIRPRATARSCRLPAIIDSRSKLACAAWRSPAVTWRLPRANRNRLSSPGDRFCAAAVSSRSSPFTRTAAAASPSPAVPTASPVSASRRSEGSRPAPSSKSIVACPSAAADAG